MSDRGLLRCRLGRHDYRYVGEQWVQDTPWMKSGWNHECARCGRHAWFGRAAGEAGTQ